MDERIMIHDQYKARQREILGTLNAKIVMQVCGNFALKEELGALPPEINQRRADEHNKFIVEAATALDELMLEVVGEDDGSSLAEFARNKLRDSIRAVIKGDK